MIQQTISAPRWWKRMSMLVLLVGFKIGMKSHDHLLWTSSPPWRNSVGRYVILYGARTDNATDDFRSKILESDVLAHLVGFLQDRALYAISRVAITTFAEFGGFLYHFLYSARTDDLADDFRSKLVETDVLTHLIGLLQDRRTEVQWTSMIVITTLAKFCKVICHFVQCES